jgi:hypothetical protein
MQLKHLIAIGVLGLTCSVAMAEEVNCSTLANPQARQQCLVHKYDNTPDCAKLANPEARKECAEFKVNNGNGNGNGDSVDCSKLATPAARQQCAKQKAK